MAAAPFLRALLSLLALALAAPTWADSWMPAQRTTYHSADGRTRVTVIPREIESRLAYFTDKVAEKEPAGQRGGGEPAARAVLEQRKGGRWVQAYDVRLVNEVAPVSALVANGGAFLVTFDNWHSAGLGDHVVVIYRSDGTLVRSLRLGDILPADYIRALPRSVSSLWWGRDHRLAPAGKRLILKVVVPSASAMPVEKPDYVDVALDLASGLVAPPSGRAWDRALAAAAPIAARDKAAEADTRAHFIAPLVAPATLTELDWIRYLHQATRRLSPPRRGVWSDPVWVLPAPSDPNHAEEAKNVREALAGWDKPADMALASPASSETLARIVSESAAGAKAGRLKDVRLFIALPGSLATGVREALTQSGAEVIVFDPAQPIPQRPEALRAIGVEPSNVAAEAAKARAEAARYGAEAIVLEAKAPRVRRAAHQQVIDMEEIADRLEAEADAPR